MSGHRPSTPSATLAAAWMDWAGRLRAFDPDSLDVPTRCEPWTVLALATHVAPDVEQLRALPGAVLDGPAQVDDAAALLRIFNEPGGVAHSMAPSVAEAAASGVATASAGGLATRFEEAAGIVAGAPLPPEAVIPHPVVGTTTVGVVTDVSIVEATVHMLDVVAAVGGTAPPVEALRHTVCLLARIADPERFIEAATGRGPVGDALPVMR